MAEISKTADNAIALLFELSSGARATPLELTARTGLNRTVVQRLLTTLLLRGFVSKLDGTYQLTPQVRELAESVQTSLRKAALPSIRKLFDRVDETVVFQIVDDLDAVVLIGLVPTDRLSLQVRHDIGSRTPLTQSASGLAILAASPLAVQERVVKELENADAVWERLGEVAAADFARTSDELQEGVSGIAMAVRHGDEVVGSLGILVPSIRSADLDKLPSSLRTAVRGIEKALAASS